MINGKKEFLDGVKDSMPVFIAYFAVSFGLGAAAVGYGIRPFSAAVMSITNLTSAGEFAALDVIRSGSSLMVMLLCQLVINSRYALMSVSLSQRMSEGFPVWRRLAVAFLVTDELFALSMVRKGRLTPQYMYGLGALPVVGWTLGTLFGALMSSALPLSVQVALGVALYGMFIAVVLPQITQDRKKLVVSCTAVILSCIGYCLPALKNVSSGLIVAICTVLSAGIGAVLYPMTKDSEEDAQ